MKQLSGLDAAFLYLETPEMPMHVGSLHLYERPAGARGDFAQAVRKHIAARMHLASVFTRRLASMPLNLAAPVWVDAEEVDLEFHVRKHRLPRPGGPAQLEACVGRLHSALMDRSRPLWEFHVIEGLKDGHVGVYAKVHHAAIDGQAGVALANAILDLSPVPREVPPPRRRPARAAPTARALLGTAVSRQLSQYARLVGLLPQAARAARDLAGKALEERKRGDADRTRNWQLGPRTSLNTSIGGARAFATASVPLADIRAIGHAFGASINDVVLALCAGALRGHLERHGELPDKPLIAAVPVSLRAAGDATSNNQASMTLVNLHTDIADPVRRLAAIVASTGAMKEQLEHTRNVLPTDFPTLGAPWLIGGLAALYGRAHLAERLPTVANVAISNVPGPQVPLYMAGARMLTYHPVSIVVHGIALNITVESYNGSMEFGFTACAKALPDLRTLASRTTRAFAELLRHANAAEADKAAQTKPKPANAAKPPRRRAPAKTATAPDLPVRRETAPRKRSKVATTAVATAAKKRRTPSV